jgi:membrane protease YdiL (CAAX protease family)
LSAQERERKGGIILIVYYRKNPLLFSLVLIAGYVFLVSLTDTVSAQIGVQQIVTLPALFAVAVFLARFIRKNGLRSRFGLIPRKGLFSARYLYLIPFAAVASSNLWGGTAVNFPAHENAVIVLAMLLVGFVEEIIFRGFLFRAIADKNLKSAVIISSVSFGLGHIVNLLTAASVLETLLQIAYATSIGFLFTVFFVKSGSLLPCIAVHGGVNALSAFAAPGNSVDHSIQAAILLLLSAGYAVYLWKAVPGMALERGTAAAGPSGKRP